MWIASSSQISVSGERSAAMQARKHTDSYTLARRSRQSSSAELAYELPAAVRVLAALATGMSSGAFRSSLMRPTTALLLGRALMRLLAALATRFAGFFPIAATALIAAFVRHELAPQWVYRAHPHP